VHDVIMRERLRGREAADFDTFFRAEHPRLVAMALALTGVPEVARDLAQESLAKASSDWGRVSSLDKPGAWVRRVTINAAMSWHRSQRRADVALRRLDRPDRPGGGGSGELPQVESDRFWVAVRSLPDRQRAVVALFYLEDMSVAEVAALLEISPGTVKSSLSAARATLAAALGVASGVATSGAIHEEGS
jgi:RNA polymerase sigma-70 factor (sigma-E family)